RAASGIDQDHVPRPGGVVPAGHALLGRLERLPLSSSSSEDDEATTAQPARFDKVGNPMPATGYGCGCQICADAHAERVRRTRPLAAMRGRIARLIEKLVSGRRPQAA